MAVRAQVGRYFGMPEDKWFMVPGSSVNGGWSRWQTDDQGGEFRERTVTSTYEAGPPRGSGATSSTPGPGTQCEPSSVEVDGIR